MSTRDKWARAFRNVTWTEERQRVLKQFNHALFDDLAIHQGKAKAPPHVNVWIPRKGEIIVARSAYRGLAAGDRVHAKVLFQEDTFALMQFLVVGDPDNDWQNLYFEHLGHTLFVPVRHTFPISTPLYVPLILIE